MTRAIRFLRQRPMITSAAFGLGLFLSLLLGGSPAYADFPLQLEKDQILELHNEERQRYGLNPLVWDDTIAGDASNHANGCTFGHSTALSTKGYGENVAYEGFPGGSSVLGLAKLWADERPKFDCRRLSERNSEAYHYQQMIWASTRKIGCGVARCGGRLFLVCNYQSFGNITGQNAIPAETCEIFSLVGEFVSMIPAEALPTVMFPEALEAAFQE